ncbi:MAG: adenosylcobinamide-phosphate synthase CbiB [Gammaproteobacteria bacterium]|nr:adenosylcobinamide-phosphate synthase CbiB [Gammaproteobacteria bacterium]MBU0788824.1 adenosylcobinamide-phosphate synthase CbiB [Gammaproteobacteria bacterium]MBU0814556.1 adenosylcobinamide-phosphate synthase CbiB [Gammaproteobacteria bacterium]MBU1786601.1 adenosylcobinamide-phosphate synthase CbiB [Gammaproteobacteria bacterium]
MLAVPSALWVMLAALWLALLIDVLWGEPPAWMHPVVGMGQYLAWCGRWLLTLRPVLAFNFGALSWLLGAASVGTIAWAVQTSMLRELPPVFATVLLALWLKPLLAWRMLRDEVGAVETALQQSLEAGRAQLARLVSRDVSALTESQVRESAIESLAENLNDSVVAPIFWFVLLGLPGAAVYRFANTADAMWGYRGRWEWAGKWAARLDDVLSWLPARLTALLLATVAGGLRRRRLPSLRQQARLTPSPNSGWPMAAMALALGTALHKPGVYVLNPAGRAPLAVDTLRALSYASKSVLALMLLVTLATLFIAMIEGNLA